MVELLQARNRSRYSLARALVVSSYEKLAVTPRHAIVVILIEPEYCRYVSD
jgi:hypothetical protein